MNKNELTQLSIEYLKSYLSVNSYVGCNVDCAYCFLAPMAIVPCAPQQICDERRLVEQIISSKYFVEGKTVLSINNRTDPFVCSNVKESTLKILEALSEKDIKNTITITTKGYLSKHDVDRIADLGRNIVILATYNGIPTKIQPISAKKQMEMMHNVAQHKEITLVHQLRPIIPGINDSIHCLRQTIKDASNYCCASVYQGIRVNDYIRNRLADRGIIYNGENDKHKKKSREVDRIIDFLSENEFVDYPIFEHTSCCLSFLQNMADYNLHYRKGKCSTRCPNYALCSQQLFTFPLDSKEEIQKRLCDIGIEDDFEVRDGMLLITGKVNDEQRSYVRHILGYNLVATERESSFSEKFMG